MSLELRMKGKRSRIVFSLMLYMLLSYSPIRAYTIDDWVAQNLNKGEELLCKRDMNGEYFFLAKAGDKLKLGSRLDMTEYTQTHVFIITWVLRDEKDESPVTSVRPVPIKDKYVRSQEGVFAENVEYRTLRLPRPESISATIEVKKCPISQCDRDQVRSKEEKQYAIKVCEVPLNK